ncbi:MAG: aminoacyl-tRNA hydrolase [Alphaproteobacteria bacterium]|nr:aminoacyl-tRNA hydrolase [Alphaproteobacteria bacterium]
MWLVVGLGNPGSAYAATRHNIGFMLMDALRKDGGWSPWRKKFDSELADGDFGGTPIIALKPQTFMNLSGIAVSSAMRFYKLPPERLLVLHDDLDLPLATMKLKIGGGNGGHNGLRNIEAHIGSLFWRLRLGIGRPADKAQVHDYVLSPFINAEKAELPAIFDRAGRAIPWLLQGQADYARNILAHSNSQSLPNRAANTNSTEPEG